jgi:hypothetical protein
MAAAAEVAECTIRTEPQYLPTLEQEHKQTMRQIRACWVVLLLRRMRPSAHMSMVAQQREEEEGPQKMVVAGLAAEILPMGPLKPVHNWAQRRMRSLHPRKSALERRQTSELTRLSSCWLELSGLGHIRQRQMHHRLLH